MHSSEHLAAKAAQFAEIKDELFRFLSGIDVTRVKPESYETFERLSEDMLAAIDFWKPGKEQE